MTPYLTALAEVEQLTGKGKGDAGQHLQTVCALYECQKQPCFLPNPRLFPCTGIRLSYALSISSLRKPVCSRSSWAFVLLAPGEGAEV